MITLQIYDHLSVMIPDTLCREFMSIKMLFKDVSIRNSKTEWKALKKETIKG